MLSALSVFMLAACNNSNKENSTTNGAAEKQKTDSAVAQKSKQPDMSDLLTIALMTEDRDGKNIEFRFYERQAIYKLDKTNKTYSSNMGLLNEALKNNTPVMITKMGVRELSVPVKALSILSSAIQNKNAGNKLPNNPDKKTTINLSTGIWRIYFKAIGDKIIPEVTIRKDATW